jgi:hypothetical protein
MPTIFFYKSGGDARPIRPGASITIETDKSFVERLERLCEKYGLTDWKVVEEATIGVFEAEFASGSKWEHEEMHDPDPNNPGQRIRRGARKVS